ncbi:MAG: hypothetical protein PHT88_04810 [Candidatus Moranbacteria bacterium]|nr:hypothetical protein [Candidatus Moranbacteria bacterium]
MIDCHVLTLPDSPKDWLAQCLDSICHPQVTVHRVDGVIGHVGAGRKMGLAQGTAPYVTWIDPDDWAEPGAFDRILAELRPDGLCTAETVRLPDGRSELRQAPELTIHAHNFFMAHHFIVLRRELVTPWLDGLLAWRSHAEFWLMKQITRATPLHYLKEPLYNWRIHPGQWHTRCERRELCLL